MHIQGYSGFPGGSDGKEYACNVGDPGLIPGSGRSPGEGNGNPLLYSCLENPMDRGLQSTRLERAAVASQVGLPPEGCQTQGLLEVKS